MIGAYLDQELDPAIRREVAAHLLSCPACSARAEDLHRTSRQVAALGRERAPMHLKIDVRQRLARASAGTRAPLRLRLPIDRLLVNGWVGRAVSLILLCALTAVATAVVVSRMDSAGMLEREVVAAHVRSLLQESPTQIASSESHTVKPWFAGRIEFAPNVRDFASEGFPLAGARLDYVGERRVAALVYRRRLHVVNVFAWPSLDAADGAAHTLSYRGYNIVAWTKSGIAYWAISDLNMGELRLLQTLL
jgi:anti-sigma factor RsiW